MLYDVVCFIFYRAFRYGEVASERVGEKIHNSSLIRTVYYYFYTTGT